EATLFIKHRLGIRPQPTKASIAADDAEFVGGDRTRRQHVNRVVNALEVIGVDIPVQRIRLPQELLDRVARDFGKALRQPLVKDCTIFGETEGEGVVRDDLTDNPIPFLRRAQLLLHLLARGDIAEDSENPDGLACGGTDEAGTDFNRNGSSILVYQLYLIHRS